MTGTVAVRVALLELGPLPLEVLLLETLGLGVLDLGVLLLVELVLEELALRLLELLWVLELLVLVALHSRACSSLHRLRRLSHRLTLFGRSNRHVPRPSQPAVPGTHLVVRRPSSPPQQVPLPSPPASSLHDVLELESDRARAAHPTVTRLLATAVTDPSFESASASALVTELVNFAAACRLDYATSLVVESESVHPPSFGGECALGPDVLEDMQEDLECLAAAAPHLVSMLLAPEGDPDAPDIPTPRF
ncbi:unnamed protein product [Closterium sp. NIES-65]|nr:unnamed protein product [Closterium sp. NIES-65]